MRLIGIKQPLEGLFTDAAVLDLDFASVGKITSPCLSQPAFLSGLRALTWVPDQAKLLKGDFALPQIPEPFSSNSWDLLRTKITRSRRPVSSAEAALTRKCLDLRISALFTNSSIVVL